MGGMDEKRVAGAGDGHKARSRPESGLGRQPCRTCVELTAGHDDGMAAMIFVADSGRARKTRLPKRARVLEGIGCNAIKDIFGNTDIDQTDVPAQPAAGIKEVSGLFPEECDS